MRTETDSTGFIKQVICINWGTKYGPPFINRLYGMVSRNITPPFRFICFTDNTNGIRPEVECQEIPDLECELPKGSPGIWRKACLWGDRLGNLTGPVLFLDLDLVITANIDCFFEHGNREDVVMSRNQIVSLGRLGQFERLGQTSVFRFPVGKLVPLQEKFLQNPQSVADRYRFEQRLVTSSAPGGVKFFPKSWVRHFRQNCSRTFPLNFFLEPRLPKGARIIIFPGGTHPTHVMEGRWGAKGVRLSRSEHFTLAFRPNFKDGRLKHLRHFLLAPKWVADHWRE